VTPKKTAVEGPKPSTATTPVATTMRDRKPWHKRTPVEVILDQINKLRDDVNRREEELKQAKKQLLKLDEVLKALEST